MIGKSASLVRRSNSQFTILQGRHQEKTAMATERAYSKSQGTKPPQLAQGVLRLYSMRFCPYAHRTRLVLAHKEIPHETVNINLRDKPDWFLALTPTALVPILEQDGKIVYESGVCNDYLDDVYPQKKLTPSDPYRKAQDRILMESFSKVTTILYKFISSKDEEKAQATEDFLKKLQPYEEALTGKYFGGEEPSMLDFHLWPWFERIHAYKGTMNLTVVEPDKFPRINAWIQTMKQVPAVKAADVGDEPLVNYFQTLLKGAPEYDYGLSKM